MKPKGISDQGIKRIAQSENNIRIEEDIVYLANDIWVSVFEKLVEHHIPALFKELFERYQLSPEERMDIIEIIQEQILVEEDSAIEVMENFYNVLGNMAI